MLCYTGQIPYDLDLLNTNRNALISIAKLAQDVLGAGTTATGLACTPGGGLTVQIGVGNLYSMGEVDPIAYSDLGVDTTDVVLKQGLLLAPATLSCPAPVTAGFSINYLIEAAYADSDLDSTVLPYYDAANPASPYSGPGGSGSPQPTYRDGTITLNAKTGIAAVTGAQVTPAADTGYVGLYVVTVANGQATIVSGNIITALGAPFLVTTLGSALTLAIANTLYLPLLYGQRTAAEAAAGVTLTNTGYPPGDWRRYGAKGGGGRASDAEITVGSGVVTSPLGGFAKALRGMAVVVVDGGASRTGGRPAPLITTIASVQSATQITLSTFVTQPGTIVFTGTLSSSATISSPSINPITAGIGLTRIWTATGANIPAGATITQTSATTLTMSGAATGSGVTTITLTATAEVCFGWDDSVAINAAMSLPYPIQSQVDTFLTTQPLALGNTGCNDFKMPPGSLLIFALNNNTQSCVTATGFDRNMLGALQYTAGLRYTPFEIDIAEIDCCNTGLDGFSLGPSMFSKVRARVVNAFRSALSELFTIADSWQEGNQVDINCSMAGLHFHHKANLSQAYQNLGSYRIQGRACGLNSVYLGINASTQQDQLGGAIRIYDGGSTAAGAAVGIAQNMWGASAPCELDGERSIALSFGSDICNSPITFVDASVAQVIEGTTASYSNSYYDNYFGSIVVEDITQSSDTRGGYQYFAQVAPSSTTILSPAAGPWGQFYSNALWLNSPDSLFRFDGNLTYAGILEMAVPGAATYTPTLIRATPVPFQPIINNEDANIVAVTTAAYATLIGGDFNMMFFVRDTTGGGGAIGFMTTDTTTITLASSTLAGINFRRLATIGLQAESTSGTRNLVTIAIATGT